MKTLSDTHCHLQDPAFTADLSEGLKRASRFGIRRFIVNGTSPEDWSRVAELATRHAEILPQFGVHPWNVEGLPEDWEEQLKAMLLRFPGAGIGEIGLDTQLTGAPMDLQMKVFEKQVSFSRQYNRPCTLHVMKAWDEVMPVLQENPPFKFLLHSFSGSAEQVNQFLKLGAAFSFGGAVIRHVHSEKLKSALRAVPADRLLLETDSPFQHPDGKEHRQEPAGLLRIAEAVAEVRGEPLSTLLRNCEENAAEFFG